MAIARQTDNKLVKPLGGCIIRRKQAGGTVEAGEAVYLDSAGKVQVTAANAVATNYAYGMSLQDAASGDWIDVVLHGPVECATGGTAGAIVYTSDTAGEFAETAGTKTTILGVMESATTLFLRPQIVSLS
jgi:hypothetical protein